ncbi:unnamed protein product, partial [Prorocentrum cordatum]
WRRPRVAPAEPATSGGPLAGPAPPAGGRRPAAPGCGGARPAVLCRGRPRGRTGLRRPPPQEALLAGPAAAGLLRPPSQDAPISELDDLLRDPSELPQRRRRGSPAPRVRRRRRGARGQLQRGPVVSRVRLPRTLRRAAAVAAPLLVRAGLCCASGCSS